YINFIDRFNIFCNSYCILIGYYFILAGLTIEECIKSGSVFPLLFGLYSSNFGDIIKVITIIADLNKGIIIDMLRKIPGYKGNSIKVIFYVFIIYYIGDIL
ncbi:hypothetical protein QBC45DRAFT_339220, partial [Copromyces sp. CBS 386.78]